jgi:hypothetical protein
LAHSKAAGETYVVRFKTRGEFKRPGSAVTDVISGLRKFLDNVTGNKRDFPDALYGVTRVVSAGELLNQITFDI